MAKGQLFEVLRNDQENGKGANASPEIPRNTNHEMGHQKVDAGHGNTEEYGEHEDAKRSLVDRRVILCAPSTEEGWRQTPGSIILTKCCYWVFRDGGSPWHSHDSTCA